MRVMITVGVAAAILVGGCDRAGTSGSTKRATASEDATATTTPPGTTAPADATATQTTAGAAPAARDIVADGIRLGDRYATVAMSRDPYRGPCDDDQVETNRRAMVYGGRPCREHAFPDETTVIFWIDWADGDDFDQRIRTMAWLGGHYFDSKTNLPFHVGAPADTATTTWGKPTESFTIGMIEYRRYGDDVLVVVERDTVVGFVVGEMPADHEAGSYEVIDEMYRRYTPRPAGGAGGVSRDDCEKVLRHSQSMDPGDPDRFEKKLPREIDQCVAEATPEAVKCALASKSMDELERCQ
jgi:hypothetical protein